MKRCSRCKQEKPLSAFGKQWNHPDGLRYACRECTNADRRRKHAARKTTCVAEPEIEITVDEDPNEEDPNEEDPGEERHAAAQARLADPYAPLKPGDLGTPQDYRAPNYDREKKQEFNAQMGAFREFLRGNPNTDAQKLAEYVGLLAEQEKRWMGKRSARGQSLTAAREVLIGWQFAKMAKEIEWPKTFGQYSQRPRTKPVRRIVNQQLADLHCGANMPGDENPIPFDMTGFNRRLGYVMQQTCSYKSQYRDHTALNLLFGGDTIEGNLQHGTDFDQDPIPVQLVAFARAMYASISYAAAHFPQVDVWALGGNHGRDKLMHHGRALSSRQYNFERAIALLVADRCQHLKNVTFHIPKAAVAVIPLFDKTLFLLHGDAEAKLKAPSASGGHQSWQAAIDKFNAEKLWAPRCDVLAGGHFHDPAVMYFDTGIGIANGPLLPPSGYARAGGFRGPCGQFLWESVEGYAVGDLRYVRVGVEQDKDASLDQIIPPFQW